MLHSRPTSPHPSLLPSLQSQCSPCVVHLSNPSAVSKLHTPPCARNSAGHSLLTCRSLRSYSPQLLHCSHALNLIVLTPFFVTDPHPHVATSILHCLHLMHYRHTPPLPYLCYTPRFTVILPCVSSIVHPFPSTVHPLFSVTHAPSPSYPPLHCPFTYPHVLAPYFIIQTPRPVLQALVTMSSPIIYSRNPTHYPHVSFYMLWTSLCFLHVSPQVSIFSPQSSFYTLFSITRNASLSPWWVLFLFFIPHQFTAKTMGNRSEDLLSAVCYGDQGVLEVSWGVSQSHVEHSGDCGE